MASLHRRLLKVEAETLDELRTAVTQTADIVASQLNHIVDRATIIRVLQNAADDLQDKLTQIIITARDAAAGLAYSQVVIQAEALDLDTPEEPYEDPEDEARANAAAYSFVAAWLLAMLGASNVKKASALQEYRLRRIAATEVANAYGSSSLRAYEGIVDNTVRKRWDATLDMKTCSVCRAHDGEEVALDRDFSGGDVPGAVHPNCRCVPTIVKAA